MKKFLAIFAATAAIGCGKVSTDLNAQRATEAETTNTVPSFVSKPGILVSESPGAAVIDGPEKSAEEIPYPTRDQVTAVCYLNLMRYLDGRADCDKFASYAGGWDWVGSIQDLSKACMEANGWSGNEKYATCVQMEKEMLAEAEDEGVLANDNKPTLNENNAYCLKLFSHDKYWDADAKRSCMQLGKIAMGLAPTNLGD